MTRVTLSSQGWAESIIFVQIATDHVVSLLMESKWWRVKNCGELPHGQ
jgi:hypothetical protein